MSCSRQVLLISLRICWLLAVPWCVRAEEARLAKVIGAAVVLREDRGLAFAGNQAEFSKVAAEYPHILDVFLCLENKAEVDVWWVADSSGVAVEAELVDAAGQPVAEAAHMTSILYNATPYWLPYGSRLEWYVSGFASPIILKGEKSQGEEHYLLSINSHLWLIPRESAAAYTLRLRLYGYPWTDRPPRSRAVKRQLLLDFPPIKIEPVP